MKDLSKAANAGAPDKVRGQVATVGAGLAVALLPAAHALGQGAGMALSGLAFAAVLAFVLRQLPRFYPHDRLGGCNGVTLTRAALACLLLAPLGGAADLPDARLGWILLAIACVGLALDGADGWLARRARLVSAFGARFDMEVDAALAAILCLLVLAMDKAGFWLLGLGFMRYAYVLAAAVWPWLMDPLPERFSRKLVCVIQIAALIALLAPPVGPPLSVWLAAGALALLAWSFLSDILWLARQRRATGRTAS